MSEIAVTLDHVSKKFQKGELYDSLRDLLPALARRFARGEAATELAERQFWAVNDVSFDVKRGEAFAVIGANGAGKSTMLKLLSRIMKPTKGTIDVRGRLSALIEVTAGFHPDLTGRENIYLNGTILGMRRSEIDAKFDEIVAFSGLEDFLDTPVKRYSSGMYARLGFSIAAHVEPEVLIVDEVLSVGDFLFQEKCVKRMHAIIDGGATVLFVSHNLRAVAELCTRAILLDHGECIDIGPTNTVIRTYLDRATVGRDTQRGVPKAVFVSSVRVRNSGGADCVRFESGEHAIIDVQITATERCEKLAIVLDIKDDSYYNVMDTSTERLGHGNFSLEPGETYQCSFDIEINMATGTFHPCISVYRYDIQRTYDVAAPAATIYVTSQTGVRGAVHCRPRVRQLGPLVDAARETAAHNR